MLALPEAERPCEAVVSGRLVLHGGWERAGLGLSFVAQGRASIWTDGEVSVPLAAMSAMLSIAPAVESFTWSATR